MLYEKRIRHNFLDNSSNTSSVDKLQNHTQQAHWDHFSTGLALLTANFQLLLWNKSLPAVLNKADNLLANLSLFSCLNMTAFETQALQTVLSQHGSWIGKRRLDQKILRIELIRLPTPLDTEEPNFSLCIQDYSTESREIQEFTEAKKEAKQTDRAKSQFLSQMSHELRTPLNVILGFSQLLSTDDTLNEEQLDSVKEVEKAGEHLLKLINELLDLAKIDAGRIDLQYEEILLEPLINECFLLVKPLAESRKISLSYSLEQKLTIHADHARIKQILINLLSNAVKYNEIEGKVLLQCKKNNKSFRIEVIDSGTGIATEATTSIFSPFERIEAGKKPITGTGIGLMITRRLIKLMKGEIGVVSQQGAGCIFWFELPLNTPESEQPVIEKPVQVLVFARLESLALTLIQDLLKIRPNIQLTHAPSISTCQKWLSQNPKGILLISNNLFHLFQNSIEPQDKLKQDYQVVVIQDNACKFLELPLINLCTAENSKVTA